ncbi:hypothetical protein HYH02_003246 [Chlamydomonas schloesseri]|uniref:Uncharacterized protein n=1 Tax=Chlamydomonas schloesseri TaxID=2026947 RepID=A0A835WRD2_9CHLO|nr:hypothetical protein HYH02_003246 [Chlamydomonas schloesseri]|eukprot:KAG2452216.1 hypothetical protein HYH02_003246 [Chlamydomonas schloesseri]
MKRAYTAQGNIWSRVVYGAGVSPTKERLNNLWNTTSLVSALLMTFTYSYIANPVRSAEPLGPNSTRAIALEFANVAGILSFVMSLFCLMFNVVFHEVDYCTTSRDERDFVLRFAGLFDSIAGLFGGSVGMLLLSVLCTPQPPRHAAVTAAAAAMHSSRTAHPSSPLCMYASIYAIHPARTFYIIVGACVLLAVALFGFTLPITVFTRFRLWIRLEESLDRGTGAAGGSDGAAGAKVAAAAAAVAEGRVTGGGDASGGEGRRSGLQEHRAGANPVEARGSQQRLGARVQQQAFTSDGGAGECVGSGLRGESTLLREH